MLYSADMNLNTTLSIRNNLYFIARRFENQMSAAIADMRDFSIDKYPLIYDPSLPDFVFGFKLVTSLM